MPNTNIYLFSTENEAEIKEWFSALKDAILSLVRFSLLHKNREIICFSLSSPKLLNMEASEELLQTRSHLSIQNSQ